MKVSWFIVSSGRFLLSISLLIVLTSPIASAGSALSQKEKSDEKKKLTRQFHTRDGIGLEIREYTPIPEATEPCTAEEADWWSRFRQAGNDLYTTGDQRAIRKFYLLMLEGVQKQYRVPLKDRSHQAIRAVRATYLESARRARVEGYVVMSVEYRADGSVGDVQVTEKLGAGLDEEAVRAARQAVFVPAIKDGAFVTSRAETRLGFDLAGGKRLEPPPPPKQQD